MVLFRHHAVDRSVNPKGIGVILPLSAEANDIEMLHFEAVTGGAAFSREPLENCLRKLLRPMLKPEASQ